MEEREGGKVGKLLHLEAISFMLVRGKARQVGSLKALVHLSTSFSGTNSFVVSRPENFSSLPNCA